MIPPVIIVCRSKTTLDTTWAVVLGVLGVTLTLVGPAVCCAGEFVGCKYERFIYMRHIHC